MKTHRFPRVCIIPPLLALLIASPARAAQAPKAPPTPPPSSWPALDQAADHLTQGRLDAARDAFDNLANDPAAPPFVHSLAILGLAETALARNDTPSAVAAWQRLAADPDLPQTHRDTARRRIAHKGLPQRDPAQYRAQIPTLPQPAAIFHVAPPASPDPDGSESKPFPTLRHARDAVRALKKSHAGNLPNGGVRILVHGGIYTVQDTLSLATEDSGTAQSPLVYEADAGQTPIFSGGVRITAWNPVSDPKLRDKLDPSIRDRALQADLKPLGPIDWGDATAIRLRPELFCNGVPQTLARWPNEGFVKTGQVLGKETFKVWDTIPGCKDGKFQYSEDRPGLWLDEPDIRLYGYWFWDWFDEYQKVASIDPAARTFTLAPPYSNYGYRKDQRYHAVNLFRELDRPGEWYLDRRNAMIYWLPPEGVESTKAATTLSVLAKPFVVLENVQHVVLLGLTFQEARGDAIHIRGGADCLVARCTIRQLGGDAIVIAGGQHHGIFGCTMTSLGCGATRVAGGDRKTLSPGNHFVENCTVSDISRIKRTYAPAVHLDGCGNRVAHNLFQRIPSSALRIEGNDHLIELNRVRRVVQESDDQGGIDMFGNPLYRGVVIRFNHWSDIRGGTECGAAGIRLDDMISGITVHGNVFQRCGAVLFGGVQIHGGKDNLVDANLFLDCYAGLSFSRWGEKRWLQAIQPFAQDAARPLYSTRYPQLARLIIEPDVNVVTRNVFARCDSVFLRDGGKERSVLNTTTQQPVDLDILASQDAVNANPLLRSALFETIPFDDIGPYAHPWQAPPPNE